jgi:hypothetical protein
VGSSSDGVIENGALRVEVAADGSFFVTDIETSRRTGPHNVLLDEGDRGDEYTYSYAGPTVGSAGRSGKRRTEVRGDRATVIVEHALDLPAGLRVDRLARAPDTVQCPVRTQISLDAGARRVDVHLTIDNRARDHRLRVLCDTGTRSLTHVAGAAFAWLDRATRIPAGSGWIERPTAERCGHDLVGIDGALVVGMDGLRDLPERRGHAGPALETPSAQCIGERTYRYCVVPLGGEMTLALAGREVREFLSPARVVRAAAPRTLVRLERSSAIQLSALRAAQAGAVTIRLFNPRGDQAATTVRFDRPVRDARAVDLREGDTGLGNIGLDVLRTAAPPDVADGALQVTLAPFEIGTYVVTLA